MQKRKQKIFPLVGAVSNNRVLNIYLLNVEYLRIAQLEINCHFYCSVIIFVCKENKIYYTACVVQVTCYLLLAHSTNLFF